MSRLTNWSLLRIALMADAIASGAMGALLALAAGPLAEWFGLPLVLLRTVGFMLIPYAALLAHLASRTATPRLPARIIALSNVLWVAGSVLLLVTDVVAPTVLGVVFVTAQALLVAILAEAQFIGIKRQQRLAAG